MNDLIKLSLDQWLEQFEPMVNPRNTGSGLSIDDQFLMYETYGRDLERIIAQINKEGGNAIVWTLIEEDNGKLVIVSGYHLCNRQGYFVTLNPAADNTDYNISYED